MCKKLILTWQSPKNREWLPVGLLVKDKNYSFSYTKGAMRAQEHGFLGFSGMNDLEDTYSSDILFPLFQNRVLNKSRPDRSDFLEWLNINDEEYSDFEELARTGGIRITDNVQLYPVPENNNGMYEVLFFVHGIRHLTPHYLQRVERLQNEEKLYLCSDHQNEYDPEALMLRTKDPVEFVGYCPKFFAKDYKRLLDISPRDTQVTVVKVNSSAPEQLKLLCKLVSPWPENFNVFEHEDFKKING